MDEQQGKQPYTQQGTGRYISGYPYRVNGSPEMRQGPVFGAEDEETPGGVFDPGREPGRKTRRLAAAILLLAACAAAVLIFCNYSVRILSEEGKITFSISKKTEETLLEPHSGDAGASAGDEGEHTVQRAQDDGTRLFLTGAQKGSGDWAFQDIYASVIDSVVCVCVENVSGKSSASGIIMSDNGYIITNAHIISGAQDIRAILHSGEEYIASVVGSDIVTDLAVLKIDKNDCQYAVFADSDEVRAGDTVLAIGNPLGVEFSGTMTDGIVCAVNRGVYLNGYLTDLIQTNAAVYDGSAGGPLINMSGQVIGINTVKAADVDASVKGIGFAIPSKNAKPVIDELIEKGFVSGRPSLGFEAIDYNLPAQAAAFFGTPGGVMAAAVYESSDAYYKGIKAGDIIVALQGTEVSSVNELTKVMSQYSVGDSVTLIIYRKGAYYQTELTLADESSFRNQGGRTE
ncbi:MAG: trypsin-like peptidase domain-containing protein [Oscillospiraceae bacterium]|nr:trypsin-like peptidase domain-containing protein [Oscillospiraceae bacterium]